MIPRAKQSLAPLIPDRESKIATQSPDARFAPGGVRMQDQLGVRRSGPNFASGAAQIRFEFIAAIQTRVRRNPKFAVQARRLALSHGFVRRSQKGVAEAYRPL